MILVYKSGTCTFSYKRPRRMKSKVNTSKTILEKKFIYSILTLVFKRVILIIPVHIYNLPTASAVNVLKQTFETQ